VKRAKSKQRKVINMDKSKIKLSNLNSRRGLLALILLLSFSTKATWWQQLILIAAVGYIGITALFGERD